jgi:excinuclease ABC subunit A
MVDQTPIGKTTRSNPASYVGAFDAIRNLFAKDPVRRSAATRRHLQLQLRQRPLPDLRRQRLRARRDAVPVRRLPALPRLRRHALPRRGAGGHAARQAIADVLDMTVSEALTSSRRPRRSAGAPAAARRRRPRIPAPRPAGADAVRRRGAAPEARRPFGILAEAATAKTGSDKATLFLFDEPTTGLHFDDIAKLLKSFRRLLAAGHSLVVIEHNLDVIRASDWIIDLGPEGGEAGGELVARARRARGHGVRASHTGVALNEYEAAIAGVAGAPRRRSRDGRTPVARRTGPRAIQVHNAREHNLKNVDVEIPRNRFTVVTGVSGSGKSTLAFDIIFAEGQRRYLESLNAYARQFVQPASRPDVDAIFGIPPTVAIEQRTSRGGRKSTVATLTEIYHFLRLLYVKLGTQHCPDCGTCRSSRRARRAIAARILRDSRPAHRPARAAGDRAEGPLHRPREMGARQGPHAPARRRRVPADGEVAAPRPLQGTHDRTAGRGLRRRRRERGAGARSARRRTRARQGRQVPPDGTARRAGSGRCETSTSSRRRAPARPAPQLRRARSADVLVQLEARLVRSATARACSSRASTRSRPAKRSAGTMVRRRGNRVPDVRRQRLNPVALAVRFREKSIADLTSLPVAGVEDFFRDLTLDSPAASEIARDILSELRTRSRSSATSAWATCARPRPRRRCRAARRSASGSRRSSARTCRASATSSTNRRSACIRATTRCCSTR